MRDLSGRVIIITGASSGIGAATAVACAKAGMDVVITARREDKLQAVAAQVHGLGRKAQVVPADVAEPGLSARLLDLAAKHFGRFDAVFANAGYGYDRPMVDVTDHELRDMFEVNFFAGVDLLRQAAQHLIASKSPRPPSDVLKLPGKDDASQQRAVLRHQGGPNHICRAMNLELRKHKIHVSSVHPVGTRTEFFEASAKRSGTANNISQSIVDATPRFFMQPAERVANAVVRCLRRPRPEVWTSFSTRFAAGLMTIWPRLGDYMMSRADQIMSKK